MDAERLAEIERNALLCANADCLHPTADHYRSYQHCTAPGCQCGALLPFAEPEDVVELVREVRRLQGIVEGGPRD